LPKFCANLSGFGSALVDGRIKSSMIAATH
jgi:hypothetical protein